MLTKTYALSEDGKWQRRLDDFVEDVVVVCANCGDAPEGRFESAGVWFAFVPADIHRNDGQASGE